jgi:hypothetical protein
MLTVDCLKVHADLWTQLQKGTGTSSLPCGVYAQIEGFVVKRKNIGLRVQMALVQWISGIRVFKIFLCNVP